MNTKGGAVNIPLTVPALKRAVYTHNFLEATRNTGRLMIFAGDQKIEHLNRDYFGPGIPAEVNDPEHLFRIASEAEIGVFATQLGMIARYGTKYPKIRYLLKLNSKTNLDNGQSPFSNALANVASAVNLRHAGLNVVGVGYTIYIGSPHESEMLMQASQLIQKAHAEGLIAVLWIYPKGPNIRKDDDIHLTAGAAGVALCLGADFVKLKYPKKPTVSTAKQYAEVTQASGNTGVLCAGGAKQSEKKFLETLFAQTNIAKTAGAAIGRNIYQRPLPEAIRMANAISAVSLYYHSANYAYDIYKGKKKLNI